jgi:pimeloyl-ACP methyl ester carboxylesterase
MGTRVGGGGAPREAARVSVALIVVTIVVISLLAVVASASALNLTGTWHANYHCEAGWCAGGDFPATDVLTQAEGSSAVTGSNGSETLSGTLSGNTFSYQSTTGGYVATATLTISADGLSWSGPSSDNNGTSGIYTATRVATDAVISGSVVDDRDLPAEGVTLKLTGKSDEETAISKTATTNAAGNYEFEVPAGNYMVEASGDIKDQNGGKLAVRKSPSGDHAPECPGTASGASCALSHVAIGDHVHPNFTYTYCASEEQHPNGKPLTGCPIIFIPGFLGSRIICNTGELWTNIPLVDFADMRLERDGVTNSGAAGSCSSTAGPIPGQEGVVSTAAHSDIYGKTLEFLNRIEARGGYPAPEKGAYAFPYDWRKSPLLNLAGLDSEVNGVLKRTGASKVVLMAHSMGGLVTQAYIENASYAKKVARAITLGTPYWGAPKSSTALMTSKSNEPAQELLGLDLFLNASDLQMAARTMQGLYWLYPSANYGPWLKIEGAGYKGQNLGGSGIDPWVASLGGTPALLNNAEAGHAKLDQFKTNGVDYEVVVGTGVPTITAEEVKFNEFEPLQFVRVWFGSGDGTVPAQSATQGAFEGTQPAGEHVPINYVCGVDHVSLPGNAGVQGKIEGFLLKGTPVHAAELCAYTGVETEFYLQPIPGHGAFAGSATGASVVTSTGTLTLEQAFKAGLIQIIRNGIKSIVVTDSNYPVTLKLTGTHLGLKVRSLTSAGRGAAKGSGPARYYGPLSGTITIAGTGTVLRNGKRVRAGHPGRAPLTTARVTRRGRYFLVRLTARASAGVAGIYFRIGKGASRPYNKPLRLTRAQLKALRFASVDAFGVWERTRKASVRH